MSVPPVASTFEWVTTQANPRHPGTGHDAGVTGWKLHAVEMTAEEPYARYKHRASLCGVTPRHGWGLDLFIEDKCSRCVKALARKEASGQPLTQVVWPHPAGDPDELDD